MATEDQKDKALIYPDGDINTEGPVDITKEAKDTLGEYLGGITRGVNAPNKSSKNWFSVNYDPEAEETSTTTADGNGTPAFQTGGPNQYLGLPGSSAGQRTLNSWLSSKARAGFDTLSNSGKFDEFPPTDSENPWPLSDILDKDGQKEGHLLLARTEGKPLDTTGAKVAYPDDAPITPMNILPRKVSAILQGHNRFSPIKGESPYIENGNLTDTSIPRQGEFGKYISNQDFPAVDPFGEAWSGDETLDLQDLRKIGLSMMYKATGHGWGGMDDPDSGFAYAESLLPSANQALQIKVPVGNLRARNAFRAPYAAQLPDSSLMQGNDPVTGEPIEELYSWGQLNSHTEPFNDILPYGMMALSLSTMVAFQAASLLMAQIVDLIGGFGEKEEPKGGAAGQLGAAVGIGAKPEPKSSSRSSSPSSLEKGRRVKDSQTARVMAMCGIPQVGTLDHPLAYMHCMVAGVKVFFGMEDASATPSDEGWAGLLTTLGGAVKNPTALKNLFQSSGFYVGILRNAIRDVQTTATSLSPADLVGLAVGAGAAGIGAATGTGGAVEVGIFMLRRLFETATWRTMMVFIQMGNAVLTVGKTRYKPMAPGLQTEYPIDSIPDAQSTKIAKSRTGPIGEDNRLAWRQSNTLSRYLLPASLMAARKLTGFGDGTAVNGSRFVSGKKGATADKDIPGEIGKIEALSGKRISKEYVHAIEDALEAEYMPFYFQDLRTNEIIAFNAFLESTKDSYAVDYASESGYGRIDPVMIYKGTKRTVTCNFILAATSPDDFDAMWYDINKLSTLIYPQWSPGTMMTSKIAGEEKQFIMPFSQIPTSSPMCRLRIGDVIRSNYSKLSAARLFGAGSIEKVKAWRVDGTKYPTAHDAKAAQSKLVNLHKRRIFNDPGPVSDNDPKSIHPGDKVSLGNVAGAQYTFPDADESQRTRAVEGTHVATVESVTIITSNEDPASPPKAMIKVTIDGETDPAKSTVIAARGDFSAATSEYIKLFPITVDEDSNSVPKDFYGDGPDQNPIMRAFSSNMGRGLAGFITSFDLDWQESTWDTSLARRAPKLIKIGISFAPIHDIPPGLDHDGFNRAPIYPVGQISVAAGGDPWGDDWLDPNNAKVKTYLAEKAKVFAAPEGEGSGDGGALGALAGALGF